MEGTVAVLDACVAAGINDVILTSSTAAVFVKSIEEGHVFTEDDFSDVETLKKNRVFYPLSKTLAEQAAWDYVAKNPQIRLVVVSHRSFVFLHNVQL